MNIMKPCMGLLLLTVSACKSGPETPPDTLPSPKAEEATPAPTEPQAGAKLRVYDEKSTNIEAHVGERVEVALPANITTPYKWSLDPASLGDVATLSEQTYSDAPPAGCEGCVGYPGTAHFLIDAAQEGEATLLFEYRKLGQTNGDAQRKHSVTLRVAP